jgi:hypothetical protein
MTAYSDFTKIYTENAAKMTKDFTETLTKATLPEVKFNKNGYEIRSDILKMAKDLVAEEYRAKYMGWEVSVQRDEKTGQVVQSVAMPEFPGLDKVLETAEKLYGFVNYGKK